MSNILSNANLIWRPVLISALISISVPTEMIWHTDLTSDDSQSIDYSGQRISYIMRRNEDIPSAYFYS